MCTFPLCKGWCTVCFFRRLAWTTDGAFLITPASLWQKKQSITNSDNIGSENGIEGKNVSSLEPPTFATYLFARHHYDQPYQVLFGLDKVRVEFIIDKLSETTQDLVFFSSSYEGTLSL